MAAGPALLDAISDEETSALDEDAPIDDAMLDEDEPIIITDEARALDDTVTRLDEECAAEEPDETSALDDDATLTPDDDDDEDSDDVEPLEHAARNTRTRPARSTRMPGILTHARVTPCRG